jgi:GWxTD domain-containing protein
VLLLRFRRFVPAVMFACLVLPTCSVQAQDQPIATARTQHGWLDPSVAEVYKKWLNEEVVWIATSQERDAFKKLLSDQQRDAFVIAFWERRNPTPGASGNEFKEEHYRRLAYANEHFAAAIPGWKDDRGHIYIVYGPPDKLEHHLPDPVKPEPLNGAADGGYEYEIWHYKRMEDIGTDVSLTFADICACGRYVMTIDGNPENILKFHQQR